MGKKIKKKDKAVEVRNKTEQKKPSVPNTIENLYILAEHRIGGAVNIRGIGFQLLYSVVLLLETFANNEEDISITLEGLEDVDLYLKREKQFYQLKTSVNPLDAGKLWTMGVFQNFYQAYQIDKSVRFYLVHNNSLSKGCWMY